MVKKCLVGSLFYQGPLLLVLFINNSQGLLSNVRGLERSGTNMIQGFFEQCKVELEDMHCEDLMPDGKTKFIGSEYRLEKEIATELAFPRPDQDRPCWKHFRNRAVYSLTTLDRMNGNKYVDKNLVYFVTLKNPYAWIPSYCGFHLKCHIENMTTVVGLVHEWNEYMTKWLYLKEKHPNRIILVKYEHILENATEAFDPLSSYLLQQGEVNSYDCITNGAKDLTINGRFNGRHMNVMMSHGKKWHERKQYYLQCEYFDSKLTYDQIKMIDLHLSPRVLKEIGYATSPCVLKAKHLIVANASFATTTDDITLTTATPEAGELRKLLHL